MSDIRYNGWLHRSGTGGVWQDSSGNVGIGSSVPSNAAVSGNSKVLNVGVVTATTYYGSGANLTGITQTTINNNANDRVITGSDTANTLEAESTLSYGTGLLTVHESAGTNANGSRLDLKFGNNNSTDVISSITFSNGAGEAARIQAETSGANNSGLISFYTDNAGTSAERARIDSSGNVLIGDSAGQIGKLSTLGTGNHISASRHSTDTSAANVILAKYRGSRSSPTVVADGDDLGNLSWYGYNGSSIIKAADITAKTAGTVDGSNMTTDLVFSTTTGNTSTERFRIQSDGTVQIGTQSAHTKWVEFADSSRDDATEIRVNNGSNSDFEVVNNKSGGKIKLYTNSSSRFEIDSDGYITNPGKRAAAFCARVSGTLSNISANGIIIYNTDSSGSNDYQAFDIGSNYNTSTGKFTCPVDGVYYFEAQAMCTGFADGDTIQDLLAMKSNRGTVSNPRQRRSYFRTEDEANGYFTNSVSGLYNGSAGDTVWVIVTHGCSVSNLGYSYFSGFLVG